MKTFLAISIFAMVGAGIYGFTDMARDLHHGTMIEYDKGHEDAISPSKVFLQTVIEGTTGMRLQAKTKAANKKTGDFFEFSPKEFSRSSFEYEAMPIPSENVMELFPEETAQQEPVPQAVADSIATKKAEQADSAEKAISPRIFSRARPSKIEQPASTENVQEDNSQVKPKK